jgi:hypothetical protein
MAEVPPKKNGPKSSTPSTGAGWIGIGIMHTDQQAGKVQPGTRQVPIVELLEQQMTRTVTEYARGLKPKQPPSNDQLN